MCDCCIHCCDDKEENEILPIDMHHFLLCYFPNISYRTSNLIYKLALENNQESITK